MSRITTRGELGAWMVRGTVWEASTVAAGEEWAAQAGGGTAAALPVGVEVEIGGGEWDLVRLISQGALQPKPWGFTSRACVA
eukprot:176089-Pelagomonas_calceolata.AAC.3